MVQIWKGRREGRTDMFIRKHLRLRHLALRSLPQNLPVDAILLAITLSRAGTRLMRAVSEHILMLLVRTKR